MMHASSTNQKQKLSLLKSRRTATSAPRPLEMLPRTHRKRLGILVAGLIAGLGFPALAFAVQQSLDQPGPAQNSQSASTHINVNTSPSPTTGEDFLSPDDGSGANTRDASSSNPADSEPAATVIINGEQVPLVNGSITKQIPASGAGNVDVDVTVDHSSSGSANSSSNSSTEIHIDSSTSSSTDHETNIDIRGSPRR